MRESKAELTDRLRREGRWEAFKERREELKASGTPAAQAWFEAATEFPAPRESPPTASGPTEDLEVLKDKPPADVIDTALWVYENLDADWVKPSDAPTLGAWSLRNWARSSMAARGEFYRTFVAKLVLPSQEAAAEAKKRNNRVRESIEDLLRSGNQLS